MLNLISFAKPGSLFIVFRSFAGNRLREVGLGAFAAPMLFLKGSLRTTFQPLVYQHDFKEQGWHRALASDQCGPGLNPGIDTICRLSLLLVLFLFSGYSWFSRLHKNQNVQLQFDLERTDIFQEFLRTPKCSMADKLQITGAPKF